MSDRSRTSWGTCPTPAGAILVRDGRTRHLVATDPPYLMPPSRSPAPSASSAGYILEGSKPGAAAAAVWLSHKVLPLDERGYGYLIERTMAGARRLHGALADADLAPFRVVLLPEPDINIVCWVVHAPVARLARRRQRVQRARVRADEPGARRRPARVHHLAHPAQESRCTTAPSIPSSPRSAVCSVEEWKAKEGDGLVVLRATVMDPFLVEPPPAPDHVAGFVAALRRACVAVLG